MIFGRRLAKATLAALLVLSVGACGFGRHAVPTEVRELAQTSIGLDVRWRVQVSDPEYFGPDPFERGGVAVDETGSIVVATTSGGDVIGIDAASGDVRWRVDTGGEPFSAAPAIAGGIAYVCAPDGSVRALIVSSGGEVWRRDLGEVFHSAPTVTTDRVLIATATGHVHALVRETGRVAWAVERANPSALTVAGGGRPAAVGERVIAGFPDGSLGAIDREGGLIWLANLANGETRLTDVDTTPLVVGDAVYAGSFAGGLYRLDTVTGMIVWRADIRGATSPVMVDGRLVSTTDDGRVVWIDPATGAVESELEFDGDASGTLAPWGTYLLLAEPNDGLYVLEGRRPWIHGRFHADTGLSSDAAAHGSRIFALTDGGFVYGIETVTIGHEI